MNATVTRHVPIEVTVRVVHGGHVAVHTFGTPSTISFGRDVGCTISVASDRVSREHFVLRARQDHFVVEDHSTNGTLVGREIVRRSSVAVPYGTPILAGDCEVFVEPTAQALSSRVVPSAKPRPVERPSERSAKPPPLPTRAVPANDPHSLGVDEARATDVALRREVHQRLLENMDLARMQASALTDPSLRPKVLKALRDIVLALKHRLPRDFSVDTFIGEMADEALGLGPLESLLADPTVSEVMVIDPETIYVERSGRIELTNARFTDDDRVRAAVERIVTPIGRRIDESSPLVDARLKDGSRVNAIIRPLARRGTCITIRKFAKKPFSIEDLVRFGTLDAKMAMFLSRAVIAKKNIVISGGTGSGKTTLLNVLSSSIPSHERIVTIEDAAELQLSQPHVVSLETRPPNMEGKGEYTIRDLVKNALRMRPDRIVVGECRGGETLDMLQAMNTGHDGSLTTTHANTPDEAISRLETLVLMSGLDLPVRAIRKQIVGAVDIIVQQTRFSDGTRRITEVSELTGMSDEGEVEMTPIFRFTRSGTGEGGAVLGAFRATGYLPSFLGEFLAMKLVKHGESFL